MRNYEEILATKIDQKLKSVVCNKCGKTSEVTWNEHDHEYWGHEDMHHVDVTFEEEDNKYRSKCWLFDLCDECLVGFVKTFKHAPDWFRGNYGHSTQRIFEEWVSNGCKSYDRF
ncbi:hypothetical protein [Paenibacillus naphthalenovorans]|uniref:Uncharacterized protein n=1 Tax=Paenibacillus naphthalenovorans TaxID=162209 RepID=A0A0U2UJK3_9BACL|nr:hypothetical protein [Paenibacillus naphthalenovorans]ALS22097.1 hypothetical protein IJ22_17230 [Paenibacillus naphthalenovorans]